MHTDAPEGYKQCDGRAAGLLPQKRGWPGILCGEGFAQIAQENELLLGWLGDELSASTM